MKQATDWNKIHDLKKRADTHKDRREFEEWDCCWAAIFTQMVTDRPYLFPEGKNDCDFDLKRWASLYVGTYSKEGLTFPSQAFGALAPAHDIVAPYEKSKIVRIRGVNSHRTDYGYKSQKNESLTAGVIKFFKRLLSR